MTREAVYYHEQHTMMTQDVTVLINEKILKDMLAEEITEETKRELIQTYYVCRLDKEIKIEGKHYYGAWNAAIGKIQNIYPYEEAIIEKIKGSVTAEDLEKQFKIINDNILSLSDEEKLESLNVQKNLYQVLNIKRKTHKI